ncbi:MAG: sulfotransferase family protein [Chloroflexota bacterium]
MKIIGAGYPRTGTMSMQAALEILGYPCYHMVVAVSNTEHFKHWDDFVFGRDSMDWQRIFQDYEATVDAPACFYYRELMEAFPEAKVILTVRDAEKWYNSFLKLDKLADRLHLLGYVVPRMGRAIKFAKKNHQKLLLDDVPYTRDGFIQSFNKYNAIVQQTVPEDRLLVFEVKDGWEPLCAFLGCDVPQDVPFPHLNSGDDTLKAKANEIFLNDWMKKVTIGFALLLVILLIAYLVF